MIKLFRFQRKSPVTDDFLCFYININPSMPEVAKDAALLVDPFNEDLIAKKTYQN